MPQILLWSSETNAPEAIEPEAVRDALASGKYTEFAEGQTSLTGAGKPVPVSLADSGGEALDRIVLGESAGVDPYSIANTNQQADLEARFDTTRDKIQTFGEGVLGGLTLGALGETDGTSEGQARRANLEGYGTAGELLGIVGSVGVPVSPLGAIGRGSAIAGGKVSALLGGKAAGKIVGAGVEGSLFGIVDEGFHQTFDNVIRDRPFVAERLASAATVGGLLGLGTTAALEGAAKLVRAGKPAAKEVAQAIVTPEQRALTDSAIGDSHKALDTALESHGANLSLLKAFRDDARSGVKGIAGTQEGQFVSGLDDAWFDAKDFAIDAAVKARNKLSRFDPAKVLDLDQRALRTYGQAWTDYEKAMVHLDDALKLPPEAVRPGAMKAVTPKTPEWKYGDNRPSADVVAIPGQRPSALGGSRPMDIRGPTAEIGGTRPIGRAVDDGTAQIGVGRSAGAGDSTAAIGKGGAARPRISAPGAMVETPQSPLLRKFFDDWSLNGTVGALDNNFDHSIVGPVAQATGKLSSTAKAIVEANQMAGGIPSLTGRLGTDTMRGQSDYLDAFVDAWTVNQFAKATGKEASGAPSLLRASTRGESAGWGRRKAAQLASLQTRANTNLGLTGSFLASNAVYALVAGKLGRLLSFADDAKSAAAAAVESMLGSGRAMAATKLITAAKVSYTGNDDDATSDPRDKGEQLNNMLANEPALRERIRSNLGPIAQASPDLATEMEEVQVNRLKNLALKAPAFLAVPGAVPPAPYGAEFDYYNQYEAVTMDPEVAINALKTNSLTRAKVDGLRDQHPRLFQHTVEVLSKGLNAKTIANMSKQTRQQVELVLGYSLFPTVGPAQQAAYMAAKQKAQQTADGGPPNPRAMPRPSMGSQLTAPLNRPGN